MTKSRIDDVLAALRSLDANLPVDVLRPLTTRYSFGELHYSLNDVKAEVLQAEEAALRAAAALLDARDALTRAVGRLLVAEQGRPPRA